MEAKMLKFKKFVCYFLGYLLSNCRYNIMFMENLFNHETNSVQSKRFHDFTRIGIFRMK